MKRNFLNSIGRAAVLAASLLGLFLPAGARAQGNGQVPVQAAEQERDHSVWLRIMAFTDAPVVGADVRVGVHGRLLADAKAATNDQGVFPARIWRPWLLAEEARRANGRSFVRISISGGTTNGKPFLGRLSADVVLTDPARQILVVNPVTTLVSRVLDRRPELKLDQAEALVRRFLKLPANYSLGLALRQSSHYVSPFFSAGAFMEEAGDAGGPEAFAHLLLQELASGSTHPFRPPQLLGSTGSNVFSVLKGGLYAGLLDVADAEGVGNLAGWALSFTGLATPGASGDDIAALQQSLQDLQSSIDSLSTQVAQLTNLVQATATQTLYNIITTQAQTLANDVNDEENRLMYLTQDCPPQPAGATPTPPAPGSFCATEPQAILVALSNQPIYSAYTNVQGYVQDSGTLGTEGMLHLYSLWLGQTERFFSSADSTRMQNLYDYWDGVLTSAADLKVELLHQEKEQEPPASGAQLIALMGNPDATPPTTGVFQANEAANLKLMFPAVPGYAAINSKDHAMWGLSKPESIYYQGVCSWQAQGPYGYDFTPKPTNDLRNPWNPSFHTPSSADIASLIDGWSGSSPLDWLIAHGFTGLGDTKGCGFGEVVWTGSLSNANSQIYYVMDLATGNRGTAQAYNTSNDPNRGHFHWDMAVHSLAAGEQYYWYQ